MKRTHNPQVGGSSPARPTGFCWSDLFFAWRDLGDRLPECLVRGEFSPLRIGVIQRILGSAATTSDLGRGRSGPARARESPTLTPCGNTTDREESRPGAALWRRALVASWGPGLVAVRQGIGLISL